MIRYLRISGINSSDATVLYRVNKPRFIRANKIYDLDYETTYTPTALKECIIYNNAIVVTAPPSSLEKIRYYEVVIDIPENQPAIESVEEISTYGVSASVYNDNGVKICDNSLQLSSKQFSHVTARPAETVSEPADSISAIV